MPFYQAFRRTAQVFDSVISYRFLSSSHPRDSRIPRKTGYLLSDISISVRRHRNPAIHRSA